MDVTLKENLLRAAAPGMRRSFPRSDRMGRCGRERAGLEQEQDRVIQTPDRRVFSDFTRLSPCARSVKISEGGRDADSAFVLGLRGAFDI